MPLHNDISVDRATTVKGLDHVNRVSAELVAEGTQKGILPGDNPKMGPSPELNPKRPVDPASKPQ